MSDNGTIGTGDEPVDIHTSLDLVPSQLLMDGGTAHVNEFRLETASGEYVFHAEDDTIIIDYSEGSHD